MADEILVQDLLHQQQILAPQGAAHAAVLHHVFQDMGCGAAGCIHQGWAAQVQDFGAAQRSAHQGVLQGNRDLVSAAMALSEGNSEGAMPDLQAIGPQWGLLLQVVVQPSSDLAVQDFQIAGRQLGGQGASQRFTVLSWTVGQISC